MIEDQSPELLPCPFCGSCDLTFEYDRNRHETDMGCNFVFCNNCECRGPDEPLDRKEETDEDYYRANREADEEAARLWNRRPKIALEPAENGAIDKT